MIFFALVMAVFTANLCAAAEAPPAAEDFIRKGELLTLPRCIGIAVKRQPNIIAYQSAVSATQSRVGQAQANYYPQVALSGGYSRISPVGGRSTGTTTVSGTGGAYNWYSSSASVTQNIYDFGKTSTQVAIQKLNVDASRSDLENITEQIVFNVKQAYYGVLQAQKNRAVAEEAVKQFQQHLDQAKGFYEVGTKSRFDVTKAEVDLSNARLNLIRADNTLKVAAVNLNNAMGLPGAPEYTIEDNLTFKKYETTLEAALSTAFKNRPDLQAITLRRKASEEAVSLAKTGYYPSLTGNAAYNWGAENFPLDHGWNAGAALTVPLFSGFLTKQQVSEARANLNAAKANEDLVKQTIVLDVQQAYLNLKEAESRIPTAEITVKQATENLDIANGRYVAGVGSPIEVTDAQVVSINAKTTYIQALSDYKVAQASLEKAMGARQ
jgi:outer membrane protein TolC